MLVRPATIDDAANLSALATQVWLQTYATGGINSTISKYVHFEFSTERFESRVCALLSVILVAEIGTNIIGYAWVTMSTKCPQVTKARAELATLYVQEPFVGQAVGASLLKEGESWAQVVGDTFCWLTVNSMNHRAIAFYMRRGYEKIGVTYFRLGNELHENFVLSRQDG